MKSIKLNGRFAKAAFTASILFSPIILNDNSFAAEIRTPYISRQEIIIRDIWKGFHWINDFKITLSYDSADKCVSKIYENWNGTRWEKVLWEQFTYDDLHYLTDSLVYKWDGQSGWKLIGGTRMVIDTLDSGGNKLILYGAQWHYSKKLWNAQDSVFYDRDDRVIKIVSRSVEYSKFGDSTTTIKTIENTWHDENKWVEENETWRSDTRETDVEKYRYRKTGNLPLPTFAVDYWDASLKNWISNTAMLFSVKDTNGFAYDSIVELIDDRPIPTYVESQLRDSGGNLLLHRVWKKDINEQTNKSTGYYYKWERIPQASRKAYTETESTFVMDTSANNWKLVSYENRIHTHPANMTEWGYYDGAEGKWEQVRAYDTLVSCGMVIKGEEYYDANEGRWYPMVNFLEEKDKDSTVITTEVLDLEKNEWVLDSLFVIRLDSEGKIKNRINYAWERVSALRGDWVKHSRVVYMRRD